MVGAGRRSQPPAGADAPSPWLPVGHFGAPQSERLLSDLAHDLLGCTAANLREDLEDPTRPTRPLLLSATIGRIRPI